MGAEGDARHDRAILPRAGVDLLVNVISLLAFAGLAVTGLFFMEEGRGPARELHEQLGYLVVVLVAVHVVRHSRWIASVAAGKLLGDAASRRRTWAALALTRFPSFIVNKMKGTSRAGTIGLYVDVGTEGYFKDFRIISSIHPGGS